MDIRSAQELYDLYRVDASCRGSLIIAVRLILVKVFKRWLNRRHLHWRNGTLDDLVDDALVRIIKDIDHGTVSQLKHIIFTNARVVFRAYIRKLGRERVFFDDEMYRIIDRRYRDSSIFRPSWFVEAGTIWSPKTMLTIPRAAFELGISRSLMYRLVAWGEIESVVYGGRRVVTVAALRNFREKMGLS